MTINLVATAIFVAVAAYVDRRTLRLPNAITLSFLLVAFTLQTINGHPLDSLIGAAACAVPAILAYVGCSRLSIGGGDVKLFIAIGAAIGARAGLLVEALTAVAALMQPPAIVSPLAPDVAWAFGLVALLEVSLP